MKRFQFPVFFVLLSLGSTGASQAQTFTFDNGVPGTDRWFAEEFDDNTPPNLIDTNWDSLVIPNSPSHNVLIDNHHAHLATMEVQLNSLTVGPFGSLLIEKNMNMFGTTPLVNQGSIVFRTRGDKAFTFNSNFINSGTFEIDSEQSGPAALKLTNSGGSLQGGGRIIMKDVGASTIDGMPGAMLTISDQTIEGAGFIGENNLEIVNAPNGLITANTAIGWRLNIDAATGGLLNEGILRAENGGRLRLLDSVVDNNNGLIHSDVDSKVELWASTIAGGNLIGDGDYLVDGGTTTFEDVDFASLLTISNGNTLKIIGTLDNSGTIETGTQFSPTVEVALGGVILQGGGSIRLRDNSANITGFAGEVLTIADQTIEGNGAIGLDNLEIINSANSFILANDFLGRLTIDTGPGGMVNDGTMRAEEEGTLRFFDSMVDNTNGTIQSNADSLIELWDCTITGGSLTGNGEYVILNGVATLVDLNFGSTLLVGSSDTLEIAGTLNNSGYIETNTQNGKIMLAAGGATLDGGGTISLKDEFSGPPGETATIAHQTVLLSEVGNNLGADLIHVVNAAGGVIEAVDVSSTIDPFGTGPWTNEGTVRMATNRSVTLTVRQSVVNNGTLDARGGTIRADGDSLTSTAGSIMMGGGTFRSNDAINLGGMIAPGNSAGEMTLNGNVSFDPGADLQIELASAASFDVLTIVNSAPVALGGTLNIFMLNGFIPTATDSFVIVDANDTLSGSFSNVASGSRLTTADGLGSFEVVYGGGTTVVLSNFVPNVPVLPNTMSIVRGVLTNGTLAELTSSDNADVSVGRDTAGIQAVVEVEIESSTTVFNPSAFSLTVESSAFYRSEVVESVALFDYDAGQFVEMGSQPASRFSDHVVTAIGTGDLSRFVEDGTGNIKSVIRYRSTSPRQNFTANVDHAFWAID